MDLLIYSLAERPVNPSRFPDSARGWMIRAVICRCTILDWLTENGPAGWYGKTLPGFCRRNAAGILVPSSAGWSNAGTGSLTEFLTLNMSEHATSDGLSLNDADVCSLSDILETGDLPRPYYLTPKACAGILRRAADRGKDLPAKLFQALQQVAEGSNDLEKHADKTR